MEEGKDCVIETACRLFSIWLLGNEALGLCFSLIIISSLLIYHYWYKPKRRNRAQEAIRLAEQARSRSMP